MIAKPGYQTFAEFRARRVRELERENEKLEQNIVLLAVRPVSKKNPARLAQLTQRLRSLMAEQEHVQAQLQRIRCGG